MAFYVYKITNLVNDKVYVGKTKNPRSRWYAHTSAARKARAVLPGIRGAMAKHGVENFHMEVIETCETEADVFRLEREWIAKLNTRDPTRGYNLTDGGEGASGLVLTEEHRRKLSEAGKGPRSHRYGKPGCWTGRTGPRLGQPVSDEARANMSAGQKGRRQSPETVEKIRQWHLGQKASEQARANMRAAQQRRRAREAGNATWPSQAPSEPSSGCISGTPT